MQDKVVASMAKQSDPQDPEVRQLPSEGLSCGAIRQRLNHKVLHSAWYWSHHSMQSMAYGGLGGAVHWSSEDVAPGG